MGEGGQGGEGFRRLAIVATLLLTIAANPQLDRELIAAIENADLTAVTDALAAGADPDARKSEDWIQPTALMLAAEADRADLVTALLSAGADVEAKDAGNATAVMWAVTRRANDALAVLVRAGADVRSFQGSLGRNPLLAALAYHNEDAVKLLIEGGADVDAQGSAINAQGGEIRVQSPLMLAVEHGYPWAVRWLLDAGADVNARGAEDGRTALDIAVERGHTQLAELLKARGGRPTSGPDPAPAPEVSPPPPGYEISAELSADALSWSHLVLQRMEEPGLCEPDAMPHRGESFRFLWIRTFDEPVLVRVDGLADGSAALTALVLDGQGGYDFGVPGRRVTRTLKPKRWRAFRERVEAASFWQLPAEARRTDVITLDGASWALEGRRGGDCNVVWRLSPDPDGPWGEFRELCRTLLDLAKLGSKARPVY